MSLPRSENPRWNKSMYYRLPPRLRMFIEQLLWVIGGYLAAAGLMSIVRGHIPGPDWWLIPSFVVGAAIGARVRAVPYSISATDRSGTNRTAETPAS